MKRIIIVVILLLSGCSTMKPVPAPPAPPPVCDGVYVPGQGCKKISASDSGTTVRGFHDNTQTEEEPK